MSIKHRAQELSEAGLDCALKAGAVAYCSRHEEILCDKGDPEANDRAYAIATNAVKAGEVSGPREELLDAVKTVVDTAASGCPYCSAAR